MKERLYSLLLTQSCSLQNSLSIARHKTAIALASGNTADYLNLRELHGHSLPLSIRPGIFSRIPLRLQVPLDRVMDEQKEVATGAVLLGFLPDGEHIGKLTFFPA